MADLTLRLVKGSPLTNAEVDANFSSLNEAITVGGEPMGHEDRTTSTISFNASTRTFTIAPVSGSFVVWCKGEKVVVSSAQTVVIPNTTGMHSIYYDENGTLSSKLGYFTFSIEAPTAYVYWNATTGAAPYFGDERHGVVLDWQTHEYLHRTRGAAIANGFLASGYTLNSSATDAATQIAIESGTFFDEDMKINIVSTATPTAGTYQQNLLFPAKIPVLHLQGTSWVMDAPTDFPFKQGTSRPQYNLLSGGVWSTADVGNNQHATTWILATNNLTYPVIAIIGQSATDNQGEAEAFSFADLTLTGFPSVEFRPLYKLIYKASDGYANNVNARLVSIVDLRSISAVGSAANPATDHGNLSGLSDDDHPQYLSVDTVRSPSAAVKNSFLPAQTGQTGKFLTTDGTNPSWATMTAPNNGTLTLAVSGTGLSGSASFTADQAGNSTFTVTSNATSANTTGAIVARDGSGNFSANVITAVSFTGSASGLTGLKTVSGNSILGSGNIQIDVGVTSFNTRTGAITLSSGDVTTALGFTPYNATNPSGYTTNVGTVTGVTAGTGLTGGTVTSSGTIALATSGVTAGTYTKLTVDAYGRATVGASLSSGDVTTALGFTPYNATNPSSYITTAGARSALSFTAGSGAYNSATGAITIPTNTNQLANGAGYITASASVTGNAATATALQTARTINGVSFNGTANITVADSTKLPLSGGTLSNGDNVTLEMRPNDAGQAYLKIGRSLNGSQGTGIVEVTQDGAYGGGFYYNGDGTPAFISGETADTITFYRMSAGTKSRVFQYNYDSDTVTFTARPVFGSATPLDSSNYTSYSPTLTGGGASGTWGINITGNAATATTLQTTRTINGTGFNGSTNITITANTASTLTRGSYLTGSNFNGSAPTTWAVDATSANTASKVVARDASGNFSAGTITASLSGIATSAGSATNATNVYLTTSTTAAAFKVPFGNTTASTSGNYGLLQDSTATFTYNPSTNTLAVGTVSGALSGNATTATTLATARTINGTSFNGSANITTANWGTARTLTIGATGKSVNGSANVAWSRAEIQVPQTTTTTSVGIETNESCVAYVSSISLLGQTDGALYSHVYSSTWKHQIFGDYRTGQIAIRGRNNDVWQAWRTVLDSSNYNSYAPTKTGGGASGSWAISVTGNAATATTATTANALATGNNYRVNSIGVGAAASGVAGRVNGTTGVFTPNTSGVSTGVTVVNGDLTAYRSGGTTGVVYLSSSGSHYLYWDGTNYYLNSGNLVCTGNITAYSDERLKNDWTSLPVDFVERLAAVKSGTYTRTDTGERQAGASAQDWQKLLPEVVNTGTDDEKTLSLAYGNAALVSAVELAKEVVELRAKLVKLEALVSKLIEG